MNRNNVKITNMDNGSVIITTKELFTTMRNNLSEDSIYEYTNEPTSLTVARRSTKDTCIKILNSLMEFNSCIKNKKRGV